MVAISLYQGNLHRVPPNHPRQWPMPPPAISLGHFKVLIQKRSRTLARLPAAGVSEEQEEDEGKEEEGMGDNGCPKSGVSQPPKPEPAAASNPLDLPGPISQPKISEEDMKDAEPLQASKGTADASTLNPPTGGSAAPDEVDGSAALKMEVTVNLDIVGDNEDRKRELEKKLKVLNDKKHHLVQMLKQILNAEEEIKRRSLQSPGFRASTPLPPETASDMNSVTRHAQKISVEVNFGGDLGGESDAAVNHNIQPRNLNPMNSTSPSAASLSRPTHGSLQHNTALHNSRASMVAVGTPNTTMGNATASPSRFGPTVHQGHAASLSPVSVPVTHFTASTPSPAASGGASSVFKESRLTSSS